MSTNTERSNDALAAQRYCERFGVDAPLYYMVALTDAEFVARIDQAIAEGVQIDPEEFVRDLPDDALI